ERQRAHADDLECVAEHRAAGSEPHRDGDGHELPGGGERRVRRRPHGQLDDGGLVHPALGGPRDRGHGGDGRAGRDGDKSERAGGGGVWDTDPATANWALGAAGSLDGGLLNAGTGTVSFGVTDGGTFFVFAADPSSVFTSGVSFTLTANFADGASASASASVP